MSPRPVSRRPRAAHMGIHRALLPLLGALLLLGAPHPAAQDRLPAPPASATATPPTATLEGTTWELSHYLTDAGHKEIVTDSGRAYVQFRNGEFRMNAGCGTLRGTYLLEGSQPLFSPHVTSLLGDCPAVLAAQEQTVLALLSRVDRVGPDADGLALLDAGGQHLVTLQAPDTVPLQGQLWRLIAYRDGDAMIRPALPAPAFTPGSRMR